jgi:hypothetical protein
VFAGGNFWWNKMPTIWQRNCPRYGDIPVVPFVCACLFSFEYKWSRENVVPSPCDYFDGQKLSYKQAWPVRLGLWVVIYKLGLIKVLIPWEVRILLWNIKRRCAVRIFKMACLCHNILNKYCNCSSVHTQRENTWVKTSSRTVDTQEIPICFSVKQGMWSIIFTCISYWLIGFVRLRKIISLVVTISMDTHLINHPNLCFSVSLID